MIISTYIIVHRSYMRVFWLIRGTLCQIYGSYSRTYAIPLRGCKKCRCNLWQHFLRICPIKGRKRSTIFDTMVALKIKCSKVMFIILIHLMKLMQYSLVCKIILYLNYCWKNIRNMGNRVHRLGKHLNIWT